MIRELLLQTQCYLDCSYLNSSECLLAENEYNKETKMASVLQSFCTNIFSKMERFGLVKVLEIVEGAAKKNTLDSSNTLSFFLVQSYDCCHSDLSKFGRM